MPIKNLGGLTGIGTESFYFAVFRAYPLIIVCDRDILAAGQAQDEVGFC